MNPKNKAPGKSHRNGISLIELMAKFPDETSARKWFESIIWEDGVAVCHRCGGTNTYKVASGKPLPNRCRDCRKHFSFRHGTLLADSHVPLQKWEIAIYLLATSLKGVSSMKLHRNLDLPKRRPGACCTRSDMPLVGKTAVITVRQQITLNDFRCCGFQVKTFKVSKGHGRSERNLSVARSQRLLSEQ